MELQFVLQRQIPGTYLLHLYYISAPSYSPKAVRQEYSQDLGSSPCSEINTLLAKAPPSTSTSLCDFHVRHSMCSNVTVWGTQLGNAGYPVSAVSRQDFNPNLSPMKWYSSSCKRENYLSFTADFCSSNHTQHSERAFPGVTIWSKPH